MTGTGPVVVVVDGVPVAEGVAVDEVEEVPTADDVGPEAAVVVVEAVDWLGSAPAVAETATTPPITMAEARMTRVPSAAIYRRAEVVRRKIGMLRGSTRSSTGRDRALSRRRGRPSGAHDHR